VDCDHCGLLTGGVNERPISAAFGEIVRRRRLAAGLTQEALADRAKLHPTYIGMVERGVRNPTLDVCDKISIALGISLAALVEEALSKKKSGGKS
jgi:transcriptional regulator with XRE-family HTH domain